MNLLDGLSEPDEHGCRRWTGKKGSRGYGVLRIDGREKRVHRLIYAEQIGPVPEGMVIDHTCHNDAVRRGECAGGADCTHRACGEPTHLVATNHQQNIAEGALGYANRTRCRSGRHDITDPSGWYVGEHGRQCAPCADESQRERTARRSVARRLIREAKGASSDA